MAMHGLRAQSGLSLVELMVAMLISSFLIIGVTQIYLDNKRNYLYQQGQGENLENGRFALMLLEQQLAKAGYRRDPTSDMTDAFPATPSATPCAFQEGQAVLQVDANTLCLRYQPRNASETDCEGNTFSGSSDLSEPYAETFAASEDMVEIIKLEGGVLKCNGQSLVEGFQAFHFDYGVSNSSDAKEITDYTNSPSSSQIVRALRYSALLVATPANLTQGIDSKACTSDWEAISGEEPDCENGKLYQIVSGNVTLRNLMP
jgi:type IV pilus assembly protein PilW